MRNAKAALLSATLFGPFALFCFGSSHLEPTPPSPQRAASAAPKEFTDGPPGHQVMYKHWSHACPAGNAMAGAKDNKFLCLPLGDTDTVHGNFTDFLTTNIGGVPMYVCPQGYVMSGINIQDGVIGCYSASVYTGFKLGLPFLVPAESPQEYGILVCPKVNNKRTVMVGFSTFGTTAHTDLGNQPFACAEIQH